MSDEEEQNPSEQNEEEEEEQVEQSQQQDQEDEGSNQDQDSNQQEQQDNEDDQQGSEEDRNDEDEEKKIEPLPRFKSIQPEEFKFTSLLAQISSLSVNVDKFIETLPSQGGAAYRSYLPLPRTYAPPPSTFALPQQQKIVIMKDEDVQVDMQPQIVIQPTKIEKPPLQPKYKISSQNNQFLAQLYQQNKKLKRWQNTSHNLKSHTGISSAGSGFYGSRERFQRQSYEKGLFNVQQRNKEIDQAIQKLKGDLQ